MLFFKQVFKRVFNQSIRRKACYWRFKSILFQQNTWGTLQGFFYKQMSQKVTYSSNNCKRAFKKFSSKQMTQCWRAFFSKQIKEEFYKECFWHFFPTLISGQRYMCCFRSTTNKYDIHNFISKQLPEVVQTSF